MLNPDYPRLTLSSGDCSVRAVCGHLLDEARGIDAETTVMRDHGIDVSVGSCDLFALLCPEEWAAAEGALRLGGRVEFGDAAYHVTDLKGILREDGSVALVVVSGRVAG